MRFSVVWTLLLLLSLSSLALGQHTYNTSQAHPDVKMAEDILDRAWAACLAGDIKTLNTFICQEIRVPPKMTGAKLRAKAKTAKGNDRFDFYRECKFLRSTRSGNRLRVSYLKIDARGYRRYVVHKFGRSTEGWQLMDFAYVPGVPKKGTALDGLNSWVRGGKFELESEREPHAARDH